MSTCRFCDGEFGADDLVRHERAGCLVVHCLDCRAALGRYHRHGGGADPGHPR